MTKLIKNLTRRIGIEVMIMKKKLCTRNNRDENESAQGKWFE